MIFSHQLLFYLFCAQQWKVIMWRLQIVSLVFLIFATYLSNSVHKPLLGWPPADKLFWLMCQCFQTMNNDTWLRLKNYFLNNNFNIVLINMNFPNYHSFFQYIICVHHRELASFSECWVIQSCPVKCKFFYTSHKTLPVSETQNTKCLMRQILSKPHPSVCYYLYE